MDMDTLTWIMSFNVYYLYIHINIYQEFSSPSPSLYKLPLEQLWVECLSSCRGMEAGAGTFLHPHDHMGFRPATCHNNTYIT